MDSALTGFVRALRAAGAESSSAELIDAARAVALIGYADKANLKTALGLALAKSEAEKLLHDAVFERYFSAPGPATSAQAQADDESAQAGNTSAAEHADGDAMGTLRTGEAAVDSLLALAEGAGPQASPEAANALQLALQRAGAAADIDDIRFITQTPYLTQRVLQEMGIAALEARLQQQMNDASPAARAEAAALHAARDLLQREARALIAQSFELYGRPATETFMTEVAVQRRLGRMAPADMARMKTAVARMARKLAIRHSRRQRIQLRGQLDMRRTLRNNAGHGGMPFTLSWKQRRRDKPRIVAICDVSGSVAAHVRFLLLFLYALHDSVGELRSFAFANQLLEVSEPMDSLPFDDAFELILKELGNGSTDYGQAWVDLQTHHPDCIDRRTTVIVLGDGRSNGTDPRLDLFAEIADRAKRVVWLCPEPPGRWGTGDSAIKRYRPYCTSLSYSSTAADLERIIDEALQAYH